MLIGEPNSSDEEDIAMKKEQYTPECKEEKPTFSKANKEGDESVATSMMMELEALLGKANKKTDDAHVKKRRKSRSRSRSRSRDRNRRR